MARIPSFFDFAEDQAISRQQKGQLRAMDEMNTMFTQSDELMFEMVMHQQGMDEQGLRQWAGKAAKNYFTENQPGVRPTKQAFNARAKINFNRLNADFKSRSKEFKKRGEEAIKRGALVDAYDVVLTPEQEENLELGNAWFKTARQVQHSYLRNGMVPSELVTDFMSANPTEIENDKRFPEALRKLYKEDLEAPQYSAPGKDETKTGPLFGIKAAGGIAALLGSFTEATASFRASDLKQVREAGALEQLWSAGAPSEDDLKIVDLGGPDALDPFEQYPGMRKRIHGVPSEEYTKGIPQVEPFRFHPEVSVLEKFVEGAKGLVYADDRASWTKELGYIRNGYAMAAHRALEDMDPSDSRHSRYFMKDEDRWTEARKRAKDALVSKMKWKHETAQEEWWDSLSWAQDIAVTMGIPVSKDELPEYTAPPKVLAEAELNEDQVNALATQLYQELPVRKMTEDMIALDGHSLAINNPEGYELLHNIVLDPLNFINPFKPIVSVGVKTAKGVPGVAAKVAPYVIGKELTEKAAVEITRGTDKLSEWFVHYTKREKRFKDFDDRLQGAETLARAADDVVDSELARSAARGAESKGQGAAYALQSHANRMAKELKKAKKPEDKAALFDVMDGKLDLSDTTDPDVQKILRQRAREDEYRAAKRKWKRKGRKQGEMQPIPPEPLMDAQEAAEAFARIGVKTGQLPKHLADVPLQYRIHSDNFEKLAREHGQFNSIVDGIIKQARYVPHHIPRYLQYTEDIHKAVISPKAGYRDIADAGVALNPEGLRETLDGLREINFVGTTEEVLSKAAGDLDALPPMTPSGIPIDRDVILDANHARKTIDPKHWDDIENIKHAMLDVDIAGSNALHRVSPVTKSAKERTPIGELYPWLKDPGRQAETYTRAVIQKVKATAEMQELTNAFGLNGAVGVLGGPSMFHISRKGLGKATRKSGKRVSPKERQRNVAKALSDHRGIEMVPLTHGLSKRLAQTVLPEGTKVGADAVAFVPKAFAERLDSLMPVVGGTKTTNEKIFDGLAYFGSWTVQPLNAIYRMKSTVLRSPAFHALNYFGAVGLGVLAHGVKALNPKLQKGAHQAAFVAGMGGNDAARATEFLLSAGRDGKRVKWTIGEAVDFAERYGIIHQGTARHGMDVAAGRGPLSKVAQWQKQFAASKVSGLGITSAQNVANFADDYQKFIALLGRIKDPTDMHDVYKTLDFVTEYAGNMNQMTGFERKVMRNGMLFYSWNRFILPHLVGQIHKNPARMAAFEKAVKVVEHSTRENAPFTGAGVPAYLWMQKAFAAPAAMQPDEDGMLSHEATMAVMETPLASLSVLAGGFYGESPIHAQLGPAGWAIINMLTGFDNTTGHAWQKELTMPGPESFDNPEAMKQWLFSAHDSWIGREVMEAAPFGGPIMNLIKLYGNNGMYDQQAELWMRLRAGRDFFGIDNLVAESIGAEGLSIPGQVSVDFMGRELMIPAPFIRGYAVRPISEARRQQKRAMEAFQGM